MFKSKILLVPGLGNSGKGHWQTNWEEKFGFERIMQRDWDNPNRTDWVNALNTTISKNTSFEIVLIGHSLGCATVGWWHKLHEQKVKGALLVAPADTDAPNFPPEVIDFAPMPLQRLPFPTIVVASTNDQYVSIERAHYFANCWGSRFINIGAMGHINAESGLGDWLPGFELLKELDSIKS